VGIHYEKEIVMVRVIDSFNRWTAGALRIGASASALLLSTGIAASGCSDAGSTLEGGTDALGAPEETAEAAQPLAHPSRIGPYTTGKLADGTPVILDGNGARVIFHGVSRPGLESAWHGEGPSDPALYIQVPNPAVPGATLVRPGIHAAEYGHMKQWGFDAVRLSVSWNYRCYGYRLNDSLSTDPDADLPCNNPSVWEIYWHMIRDNVKKIQAQGMDVIIDVRSDASERGNNGVNEGDWNHFPHAWQQDDGTAQSVSYGTGQGAQGVGTFLRRLGFELGYRPGPQPNDGIDRSRVVFQIFNTPHTICQNTADWSEDEIWRIWLDGTKNPDGSYGTKTCVIPKESGVGSVTTNFRYAGVRVLYERVREMGAQNVILVTGIDGVDLRRVAQPQYQIPGATNLAYAVNPAYWFAEQAGAAGVVNIAALESLFDEYFGHLALTQKFPVVITEFSAGEPGACSDDDQIDFLHEVLLYATRPNRQLSWAAWSWFIPDHEPSKKCSYYSSIIGAWRGPGGGAPSPSVLGRGVKVFLESDQYIWPVVTSPTDDCDPSLPGTLSWALKHALPGQWIRFDLPRDAQNNASVPVTCGELPIARWGVRMVGNWPAEQGVCGNGKTTIAGTGASGDGLVLEGNNDITAIHLTSFPGSELVELQPFQSLNKKWCTTTSP
jgi:hypothetical protein